MLAIMARIAFHPNAYLSQMRNVQQGLASRTKILRSLERKAGTAQALASASGLSYVVVLHHLRLLEVRGIAMRKRDKRPFLWVLTGVGQRRLTRI
jgi:predicted ArsR family transcriptional regulator